ncbi:MAG: hypothetical protein AAGK21_00120 [Bacteroidota bacterium]
MLKARDQRLLLSISRELDDTGSDTLRRYFAQVQYTVAYCVRMLRTDSDIVAIYSEYGDDLVVERGGIHELRQIKTRDESRGAWRFPEVMAVLCKQYAVRDHFSPGCTFHFVSNRAADPTSRPRGLGCGPLYRLKDLLLRRLDGALTSEESGELAAFKAALCPEIARRMREDHGEALDVAEALDLLLRTRIETEDPRLREFNWPDELHQTLSELDPERERRLPELKSIWEAIALLVVRRVINGSTPAERRILRTDVEACLQDRAGNEWDAMPGGTLLERKCLAGGFDRVRVQNFSRQRLLAAGTLRRLTAVGLTEDAEWLASELSERQAARLEEVGGVGAPGPEALRLVKPELGPAVERAFGTRVPERQRQSLGEGILWEETQRCHVRWDVPPTAA